jgi:hypothetical protein
MIKLTLKYMFTVNNGLSYLTDELEEAHTSLSVRGHPCGDLRFLA